LEQLVNLLELTFGYSVCKDVDEI